MIRFMAAFLALSLPTAALADIFVSNVNGYTLNGEGRLQRFTGMQKAVLFATDVAARGLDFPAVDWVVQVDAPEDAETYVHRVGRTARYESAGRALLFLMPSEEEGMKAVLEKKGLKVEKIKIKASKKVAFRAAKELKESI